MIEVVLHRVGVVTLSILSCAAHQILTNSMLFTITHRFMAGSSKVIGQRKKRRKLGSESGSGNLRNTRRAPASLARDPKEHSWVAAAAQKASMGIISKKVGVARKASLARDYSKKNSRVAAVASPASLGIKSKKGGVVRLLKQMVNDLASGE